MWASSSRHSTYYDQKKISTKKNEKNISDFSTDHVVVGPWQRHVSLLLTPQLLIWKKKIWTKKMKNQCKPPPHATAPVMTWPKKKIQGGGKEGKFVERFVGRKALFYIYIYTKKRKKGKVRGSQGPILHIYIYMKTCQHLGGGEGGFVGGKALFCSLACVSKRVLHTYVTSSHICHIITHLYPFPQPRVRQQTRPVWGLYVYICYVYVGIYTQYVYICICM